MRTRRFRIISLVCFSGDSGLYFAVIGLAHSCLPRSCHHDLVVKSKLFHDEPKTNASCQHTADVTNTGEPSPSADLSVYLQPALMCEQSIFKSILLSLRALATQLSSCQFYPQRAYFKVMHNSHSASSTTEAFNSHCFI